MAYFFQTRLPDPPKTSSLGFWVNLQLLLKKFFSRTSPSPSVMGWPNFFQLASKTLLYWFLRSIHNFC